MVSEVNPWEVVIGVKATLPKNVRIEGDNFKVTGRVEYNALTGQKNLKIAFSPIHPILKKVEFTALSIDISEVNIDLRSASDSLDSLIQDIEIDVEFGTIKLDHSNLRSPIVVGYSYNTISEDLDFRLGIGSSDYNIYIEPNISPYLGNLDAGAGWYYYGGQVPGFWSDTGFQNVPGSELVPIARCFLAGTAISLSIDATKPIEEILPGDKVTSYDGDGYLVPGKVTRVFRNRAKHILDVFGLHVTPGHVTLCGDGKFDGQHVPMIDILRSDGAFVREDGSKIRACTHEPLGSTNDQLIWAITGEYLADGSLKVRDRGQIRLGTRYITDDGYDVSVADLIAAMGASVSPDGLIVQSPDDAGVPFLWTFTPMLPRPEDYILQRSALTLNDVYDASEWEAVQPRLPAPAVARSSHSEAHGPEPMLAAAPDLPGGAPAPTMNRKQRKALAARQRKSAKRIRGGSSLH